jgi:5-methylcytosine-specific restriction endonuclease McrA
MHCKSPILQHPLTKCHIIALREMQKIKMNTNTPNQNKYNTKNTLTSRPNRLKKKKKKKKRKEKDVNPADPRRPWVWPDPLRPRVRRARWPIGLGIAGREPSLPDSKHA